MFSPNKKQVLAVNGEIYNHQEIRRRFAGEYEFQTGSDCEVILALYKEWKQQSPDSLDSCTLAHFLEQLSGIFAFALYDEERDEFLIARDPIGVIPLYIGYDSDGKVYVASELKALEGRCPHRSRQAAADERRPVWSAAQRRLGFQCRFRHCRKVQ